MRNLDDSHFSVCKSTMTSTCHLTLLYPVHWCEGILLCMLQEPRWLWSPTLTCACGLC